VQSGSYSCPPDFSYAVYQRGTHLYEGSGCVVTLQAGTGVREGLRSAAARSKHTVYIDYRIQLAIIPGTMVLGIARINAMGGDNQGRKRQPSTCKRGLHHASPFWWSCGTSAASQLLLKGPSAGKAPPPGPWLVRQSKGPAVVAVATACCFCPWPITRRHRSGCVPDEQHGRLLVPQYAPCWPASGGQPFCPHSQHSGKPLAARCPYMQSSSGALGASGTPTYPLSDQRQGCRRVFYVKFEYDLIWLLGITLKW